MKKDSFYFAITLRDATIVNIWWTDSGPSEVLLSSADVTVFMLSCKVTRILKLILTVRLIGSSLIFANVSSYSLRA